MPEEKCCSLRHNLWENTPVTYLLQANHTQTITHTVYEKTFNGLNNHLKSVVRVSEEDIWLCSIINSKEIKTRILYTYHDGVGSWRSHPLTFTEKPVFSHLICYCQVQTTLLTTLHERRLWYLVQMLEFCFMINSQSTSEES